nr:MAG TPA: hypothetical protein [Caudoviricetes sp.]
MRFLCRVSHKRARFCAWYVRACSVHMLHGLSCLALDPTLAIACRTHGAHTTGVHYNGGLRSTDREQRRLTPL